MGIVRFTGALALLALFAGCASTPQASSERDAEAKRFLAEAGRAVVYVYRNDLSRSGDTDSVLVVSGRLIGATLPGAYFRVSLPPGPHELYGIVTDLGRLTVEARAGELHFVSLNVENDQSRFAEVDAAHGRRTILECCVLLENWAPGQRPLFR